LNGSDAEQYAERFLRQQNLVFVARNYRCRFGEIDLIMRDRGAIVFIEVRMRRSAFFGGAANSITPTKQGKLLRTARHYLATLHNLPPCRFDAVLLSGSNGEEIEWIKNAFGE
jgi:putative endonuclease